MFLRLNYIQKGCSLPDEDIEKELRILIEWMKLAPKEVQEGGNPTPAPEDYFPGAVFGEFNVENLYSVGDARYEYEYSDMWQIDVSNAMFIDVIGMLILEGAINKDEVEIYVNDDPIEFDKWPEYHPIQKFAKLINTLEATISS